MDQWVSCECSCKATLAKRKAHLAGTTDHAGAAEDPIVYTRTTTLVSVAAADTSEAQEWVAQEWVALEWADLTLDSVDFSATLRASYETTLSLPRTSVKSFRPSFNPNLAGSSLLRVKRARLLVKRLLPSAKVLGARNVS